MQAWGRKLIRIPLKRGENISPRPKSHHDSQGKTLLANVALINFILQRQQADHVAPRVLGEHELPHNNDSSHFSCGGELRWDTLHHPDCLKGPQDEEKENQGKTMCNSLLIMMEEEGSWRILNWVEQCVTKSIISSKVYGVYVPSPRQVSESSIRGVSASPSKTQG